MDTTRPLLSLGLLSVTRASPTCLVTPMLRPPVNTHAPVVFAAFKRPRPNSFFNRGCSSKFFLPPCTVINSFGGSSPHSCVRSDITMSGLESWASRQYWALWGCAPPWKSMLPYASVGKAFVCFAGFQDGCGPALTSAAAGGRRRCSSARRPQKQRSPPLVVGMRCEHSLMERAAATQPPVLAFEIIPDSSQANKSLATMVLSDLFMGSPLFLLHTICNKGKYECFTN